MPHRQPVLPPARRLPPSEPLIQLRSFLSLHPPSLPAAGAYHRWGSQYGRAARCPAISRVSNWLAAFLRLGSEPGCWCLVFSRRIHGHFAFFRPLGFLPGSIAWRLTFSRCFHLLGAYRRQPPAKPILARCLPPLDSQLGYAAWWPHAHHCPCRLAAFPRPGSPPSFHRPVAYRRLEAQLGCAAWCLATRRHSQRLAAYRRCGSQLRGAGWRLTARRRFYPHAACRWRYTQPSFVAWCLSTRLRFFSQVMSKITLRGT